MSRFFNIHNVERVSCSSVSIITPHRSTLRISYFASISLISYTISSLYLPSPFILMKKARCNTTWGYVQSGSTCPEFIASFASWLPPSLRRLLMMSALAGVGGGARLPFAKRVISIMYFLPSFHPPQTSFSKA